jgi:nitrite reductase/ring-hydroxylating ferredoxin subunit
MDAPSPPTYRLIRLCSAADVEEGEALRVEVEGRPPIAVFRVKGEFFATDDTCSHGDASLAEGFVEGEHVECPWHSGRFCLKTGAALTFPAVDPIRVYTTLVQEGEIFVQSESDAP